jgi:hypothetical protein
MSIDYDGRKFRRMGVRDGVVASYRQDGDLVWADFSGGHVLRGTLSGLRDAHDALNFAYTMVLTSGEVISGHCVNTPQLREDGSVVLRERWERYGAHAASGVDYLEEVG